MSGTGIRFGLHKPLIVNDFDYLGELFRGDLGRSWSTHRLVAVEFADKLPATRVLAAIDPHVKLIWTKKITTRRWLA